MFSSKIAALMVVALPVIGCLGQAPSAPAAAIVHKVGEKLTVDTCNQLFEIGPITGFGDAEGNRKKYVCPNPDATPSGHLCMQKHDAELSDNFSLDWPYELGEYFEQDGSWIWDYCPFAQSVADEAYGNAIMDYVEQYEHQVNAITCPASCPDPGYHGAAPARSSVSKFDGLSVEAEDNGFTYRCLFHAQATWTRTAHYACEVSQEPPPPPSNGGTAPQLVDSSTGAVVFNAAPDASYQVQACCAALRSPDRSRRRWT